MQTGEAIAVGVMSVVLVSLLFIVGFGVGSDSVKDDLVSYGCDAYVVANDINEK